MCYKRIKKEIAGSDRLEITVTEKVTAEAKRLYAKLVKSVMH